MRIVAAILALLIVAAITADRHELLLDVNAVRARAGVPPVRLGHRWSTYAQRWARHMARAGVLSHSTPVMRPGTKCWGEVVGVGDSIRSVFRAFRESREHRRVLRWSCPEKVGIGVVRRDGRVWVVIEFWARSA